MVNKVIGKTKQAIKSCESAYLLVRRLKVITWGEIARPQSMLCIEGFGSSANTYTYQLFNELLNGHVSHHTHTNANIKRAIRFGVPVVLLYRDPEDAIPSHAARFGKSIDEEVTEYLDFYGKALKKHDDVILASFSAATRQTPTFVAAICEAADLEVNRSIEWSQLDRKIKKRIEEWSRTKGDPDNIALPDQYREQQKGDLRDELRRHPKIQELRHLYARLKSLTPAKLT